MRFFITGITGFVGSHLADLFVRNGDEVRGTSQMGQWRSEIPVATRKSVSLRSWDISQQASSDLLTWFADYCPDAVIHLAGASIPADCGAIEPNDLAIRSNVEGTRSLLDLIERADLSPHFIHASSCHVYPHPSRQTPPVRETDEVAPTNGYGKTKLESERICAAYQQRLKMPLTIVRGFQHTGARQAARMLLPEWTLQVMQGSECLKVRCLNTQLDLMDVRDTVAIYAQLAMMAEGQGIVNLGCGVPTHGSEIAAAIRAVSGREFTIESDQPGPRFNPLADTERLCRIVRLEPRVGLVDTVQATWEFWKKILENSPEPFRK